MGGPLDRDQVDALFEELEKLGGKEKVVFHGTREVLKRLGRGGLERGWEALSPTKLIQQGSKSGKNLEQAINRTEAAQQALRTGGRVTTRRATPLQGELFAPNKAPNMPTYSGETALGRTRAYLATKLRAGTHLRPDHQMSGGVRGVAERLSRGGWTGEGAMTKYMPLGQKSWVTLGSAPAVYQMGETAVHGRQPGGPGLGEQFGSLAGLTLPMVMFGGMPTASLVGSIGGMMGAGALGKKLDDALSPAARQQQPRPQFVRRPPPMVQESR